MTDARRLDVDGALLVVRVACGANVVAQMIMSVGKGGWLWAACPLAALVVCLVPRSRWSRWRSGVMLGAGALSIVGALRALEDSRGALNAGGLDETRFLIGSLSAAVIMAGSSLFEPASVVRKTAGDGGL